MALVIQTNNAAVTAQKNINTNVLGQNKALNRLSSGFRINSAADDAAGFAISSKLDAQGARLKAASQNAAQATALVKTAEAGVNEIQNIVVRLQSLAIQASSANNGAQRTQLDAEAGKLTSEIDKIANSTSFNGVFLLNGTSGSTATIAGGTSPGVKATAVVTSAAVGTYNLAVTVNAGGGLDVKLTNNTTTTSQTINVATNPVVGTTKDLAFGDIGLTLTVDSNLAVTTGIPVVTVANAGVGQNFQVGSENTANDRVSVNLQNSFTTTGLSVAIDLTSSTGANAAITSLSTSLDTLITQRADLGATQNQLSFVQANLATSIEQIGASVSAIRDADIATEIANFTKSQILVQAGTAMLAQANTASRNVLSLFR